MGKDEKPTVTEKVRVIPVGKERVRYKCGHRGPVKAVFDLYGQKFDCKPAALEGREKCPECLNTEGLQAVIRCCRCGFPILPGSGVIFYASPDSFKKEWTTIDSGSAVGCMRVGCCDSPLEVSGTWNGQKVEAVFGGFVSGGGCGGGCGDCGGCGGD